jgi:hypothetical protein
MTIENKKQHKTNNALWERELEKAFFVGVA